MNQKKGKRKRKLILLISCIAFLSGMLGFTCVTLAGMIRRDSGASRAAETPVSSQAQEKTETAVAGREQDASALPEEKASDLQKDTRAETRLSDAGTPEERNAESENKGKQEESTVPEPENASVSDAVSGNGKRVYLTFDDGPSVYTDQILDILKEKNIKATFFVVVKDYSCSAALNRIVSEGHTLGMHSCSHDYDEIYRNLDAFSRDVEMTHDRIYDMTGYDAVFYRFPGGSSNQVSRVSMGDCIRYLEKRGYVYLDWNAASGDAEGEAYSPEELNENIMEGVRSAKGDAIVLMHDLETHPETVEALPDLIDRLQSEGYNLLPIDESTEKIQQYRDLQKNKKSEASLKEDDDLQ